MLYVCIVHLWGTHLRRKYCTFYYTTSQRFILHFLTVLHLRGTHCTFIVQHLRSTLNYTTSHRYVLLIYFLLPKNYISQSPSLRTTRSDAMTQRRGVRPYAALLVFTTLLYLIYFLSCSGARRAARSLKSPVWCNQCRGLNLSHETVRLIQHSTKSRTTDTGNNSCTLFTISDRFLCDDQWGLVPAEGYIRVLI